MGLLFGDLCEHSGQCRVLMPGDSMTAEPNTATSQAKHHVPSCAKRWETGGRLTSPRGSGTGRFGGPRPARGDHPGVHWLGTHRSAAQGRGRAAGGGRWCEDTVFVANASGAMSHAHHGAQ